jgi:hypothetical protein
MMVVTLPVLREKWRTDRAGVIKSLKLTILYLLYAVAGIGFVMAGLYFNPDMNGLAVLAFLYSWIFYGALWLARTVPRDRGIPRWIGERFTLLDGVLVAIMAVSLWFCLR